MIKSILIANRGEIAVRVIRAAREMGIRTVAVYSEADSHAMHTQLADQSVFIGASEPTESYLRADAILDAARETQAGAIHPGYGFLSERADFAEACADAGVIFIGPPASAMRKLGAKIDAKKLAVENDVPIAPGFFEPGASDEAVLKAARAMGYPLMLKASAGGGGRGMRVVREDDQLETELRLAREESRKAFGDDDMMVERLIEQPRHIEVQVLADQHGNAAALFERECSLQRRHQKLIEEAPSPVMTDTIWERLRDASLRLVRAAGYVGAGTVEFMLEPATGEIYFLEVNARLQVEHPVTEAITGVDLVQWQIRIASGETLALPEALMRGDRTAIRGHAIESRIVAEDPAHGFMPSVGKVLGWAEPSGPGIRFDTGFGAGAEVTRFYDSLVAKLIVHGTTREDAIRRLSMALRDTHILGVRTNVTYVLDLLSAPWFVSADFDTGTLGREMGEWLEPSSVPEELGSLVGLATASASSGGVSAVAETSPAWAIADGFRAL
ncbi:MAG: ATP-grasp domain-containing protein [Fimbriimonadaceae bacterium]|nr:ATP-grasp domain-containing protein [Fimbriimonadaceae bacterium]